jgi:predicted ATP-grasp superfamily ATP-dependent carboligase
MSGSLLGRRVLLTEGSSLSARQTIYALAPLGVVIDVCDPRPWFCLARYSRHVRKCYGCPPFTFNPSAYLDFLKDRLAADQYDVILPVHDQIYLLSRARDRIPRSVALPVPEFAVLDRLQSKAELVRVLAELGLPHPPTQLVRTRADFVAACRFPCYVKLAYSTAGQGVWLVRDAGELQTVADRLEKTGLLSGSSEVLVQQPAVGTLGVVQSVFQHGRLVAAHCYLARATGVGGSAYARVGASHPVVLEQLTKLGQHLNWHGALMLDYLWDAGTQTPSYVDANPRIGETFNATLSGVNLCEALLRVALDEPVPSYPPARTGVQTHSVMMSLLAIASQGGRRRDLLAELRRAWRGAGVYAESQDELTRLRDDWPSVLPAVFLAAKLLLRPAAAAATIQQTVANYALDEAAVRRIKEIT